MRLGIGLLLLALAAGCSGESDGGDDSNGDGRDLTLTASTTFGFDDFASPGASLGVAVDESSGFVFVTALKFQLPYYTGSFVPSANAIASAAAYRVAPPVAPLVDDAAAYPLVTTAITDTAGVRTMSDDITAILLEGDPRQATPDHIYVARSGSVTLFREDGYYNTLEGKLSFTEVTNLGSGAAVASGAAAIDLGTFYFEWDTTEQP
jgi:hypothetical protein